MHQRVDTAGFGALAAHFRNQFGGQGLDRAHLLGRHLRLGGQCLDASLLVPAIGCRNGVTECGLFARECLKLHENSPLSILFANLPIVYNLKSTCWTI
ncbi:hypothetical protein D3C85_1554180 [compost metagenome]